VFAMSRWTHKKLA